MVRILDRNTIILKAIFVDGEAVFVEGKYKKSTPCNCYDRDEVLAYLCAYGVNKHESFGRIVSSSGETHPYKYIMTDGFWYWSENSIQIMQKEQLPVNIEFINFLVARRGPSSRE